VRDLCRTRADMVEGLTRARNRLGKFLLRHGWVWRGGSTWTLKHQAWLGSQRFEEPAMAQTLGHYLAVVEIRNAQLDGRGGRPCRLVRPGAVGLAGRSAGRLPRGHQAGRAGVGRRGR
jgi:hypothetical protein